MSDRQSDYTAEFESIANLGSSDLIDLLLICTHVRKKRQEEGEFTSTSRTIAAHCQGTPHGVRPAAQAEAYAAARSVKAPWLLHEKLENVWKQVR